MKKLIIAIVSMASTILYTQDSHHEHTLTKEGKPNSYAPVSVMADHIHNKGDWMFSYQYMRMNMKRLNRNSKNVNFNNALAEYMVTPTHMLMNMHMLGIMFAPSNKISLMVMGSVVSGNMDHRTRMGAEFNTETSGFSDVQVSLLYKLVHKHRQHLHAQTGISIPTGSIEQKDITPASAPNQQILPYLMQIGSGTFNAELAFTYLKEWEHISVGSQLRGTFRFGKNDNEYRLGNHYNINNWLAVKTTNWLSFSGRIKLGAIEKIQGENPDLNPMMVVTADTANSGMTYADAGVGFNIYISGGTFKNIRIGVEAAVPLFQNMNGVQLRNKESLTLGMQYSL